MIARARPKPKETIESEDPPWDSEELLPSGDRIFSSIESGIRAAKHSRALEAYIFSDDRLGSRIEEALIEAAKRGVDVRVVVDGVGSQGWIFSVGGRLRANGVNVKVYHQLPWERLFSDSSPWKALQSLTGLFLVINRRDHRKLCIIDGTLAWIGSTNITDLPLQADSGQSIRREIGMKVSGDGVKYLLGAFDLTWYPRIGRFHQERRRARRLVHSSRFSAVRINSTIRLRIYHYNLLLRRINESAVRIWIANAYFVPAGSFIEAISEAARRGVDVRIVASTQSDIFFMPWVHAAFQQALFKTGVKLYSYQPGFLHAKYMLIDDWAMVGSSNLNQRSLLHDLEADIMVKNPLTVEQLGQEYNIDVAQSSPLTSKTSVQFSWWQRLMGRLALIFKHYI